MAATPQDEARYRAGLAFRAGKAADDVSDLLPDGLSVEWAPTPVILDETAGLISAGQHVLGGMSQWGALALAADEMCNPQRQA